MNFKHKALWFLALSGSLMLGSCKKGFLDINTNPNSPTDANITPELIFPQAAAAVGARSASGNFTFLMNWLGYTGASGSYAIDLTETSYGIDQTFGEGIWQNHYNVLFDLQQTKSKALAKGDTVLAGASMILSAKLWQELVDLFGNIPYKQAFGGSNVPRPAYDGGQAIYNDLQLVLDSAKNYMSRPSRSTFATIDIVNGGDKSMWVKFANTLKLRLLIHQSQILSATPTAELAKIMDGGATLNIIRSGETIDVNPGYANEAGKQQPFYAVYGFTAADASANEITRANNYVLGFITNDPRRARLFTAVGGSYVGVDYGASQGNPTSNAASRFGPGLVLQPTSATRAQWILTSVESLFLEAEAAARGWIPADAHMAYDAAVTESFLFLGLTSTQATGYLSSNLNATWPAVQADQIKRILFQKYLAVTPLDPVEVYTDIRRVNFMPNSGYISVNPSRRANAIPNRLLYPQTEFTTNGGNVQSQNVTDIYTNKIFWQP
ncbi:MAG: SusD/RagB family nutrient-binding outer membrane lipoprotein [Chitinophagaceae bacterium]|nr:MAG: SusD/RagB family nutrient-binding outer membrane lipoprotein [Chitinophagaceae bacterium]